MAGKRVRFQHVPYFWSDLFEHAVNVVGSLDGAEIMLLRGSVESRKCTYLVLRGGYLRGALMLNRGAERRVLTELIGKRVPVQDHLERLADPSFKLAELVPPA
jgi:3-phenylpropionate/trans-cinnamate dioxygenase ferredoxin reductase subunit